MAGCQFLGIQNQTRFPANPVVRIQQRIFISLLPEHFYSLLSAVNPRKPCYFPELTVLDTMVSNPKDSSPLSASLIPQYGYKNRHYCSDIQILPIHNGHAYAGWDRTAYCDMNWYKQF